MEQHCNHISLVYETKRKSLASLQTEMWKPQKMALYFFVRPSSILRKALILVLISVLIFGIFNITKTAYEEWKVSTKYSSCVITEYEEPSKNDTHKGCFMDRYCTRYKLMPLNLCGSAEIKLFIFIFSLPENFQHRKIIRETWLNTSYVGADIKYIFLLGYDNNSDMVKIDEEARLHIDIVIIDMEESFCKLTLKALAGMYFATTFCPNAKFVMKTDDDIFINMILLRQKLNQLITLNHVDKILMGFVWYNAQALHYGQYAVSKLQYAESTYPPFCSGSGYVMSMDVTKTLYGLAMKDKRKVLLHLDDTYITGVLAKQANLEHIQLNEHYHLFRTGYEHFSDDDLQKYLVLHLHDEHVFEVPKQFQINLWNKLVRLINYNKPGLK